MEFKLDGSVDEALEQIEKQGYTRPFALDNRILYRIDINLDSHKRSMDEWKIAE